MYEEGSSPVQPQTVLSARRHLRKELAGTVFNVFIELDVAMMVQHDRYSRRQQNQRILEQHRVGFPVVTREFAWIARTQTV